STVPRRPPPPGPRLPSRRWTAATRRSPQPSEGRQGGARFCRVAPRPTSPTHCALAGGPSASRCDAPCAPSAEPAAPFVACQPQVDKRRTRRRSGEALVEGGLEAVLVLLPRNGLVE